ncbi:transcriptional regulator [Pantoea sp. OXWO6B1]|nr:transcriptional regulator [Pantoea sp. OXWO6B1]
MCKTHYVVNNWLLDVPSCSIIHLKSGEKKRLGEFQLKLLGILAENAGKILLRDELTTLVWEGRIIGNNSLPSAIHALRIALEDDGKTQKIIKTVPKKGYVLEKKWCQSFEKDVTESEPPPKTDADLVIPEPVIAIAKSDTPTLPLLLPSPATSPLPGSNLPTADGPMPGRHSLTGFLIMLLVVVFSAAISWECANSRTARLAAVEQHAGEYSHIQMYEIASPDRTAIDEDHVYFSIKDTLFALNEQIKSRGMTLKIYYRTQDQTLNYSFALASQCDNKQLVMVIYHWRTSHARSNSLIFNETMRKMNEMVSCS